MPEQERQNLIKYLEQQVRDGGPDAVLYRRLLSKIESGEFQ